MASGFAGISRRYFPQTIDALGGLNEDENPAAVQREQLREAKNCARRGNLTGTRPGVTYDSEYTAAISGTPVIQGLYEFRSTRDSVRHMIAVAGDTVYYNFNNSLNTSGSPQITAGKDNVWTFAQYQNLMWAAGGLQATDTIWSWDGNTSNAIFNREAILPGLNPKYVFTKFNALFFGGFDGSTITDNPMIARYVDYATDATVVASWPFANTIPGQLLGENPGLGTFGDEYNTGFASYQDNKGDFLLFLTNKRIISFLQNPNVNSNSNRFMPTDAIANGCVDQRAFVDLGYDQGDAIYMSENGIHSMALSQQFGNRENQFLSWPIRKTWETLNRNRLKFATASYWPDEGLVMFAVSTGSSTVHNLILVMDIKGAGRITPDTVRWYKWSLNGISVNVLRAARDPGGVPRIYVGGNAGEVCSHTRVSYSDLGSAISVAFSTKDEDYGVPSTEKSIGNLVVSITGSGNYMPIHTYSLDDGTRTGQSTTLRVTATGAVFGSANFGSATFGTDASIIRDRVRGVGSAVTISHRFSHSAINEPFFIGQITQDVAARGLSNEAA